MLEGEWRSPRDLSTRLSEPRICHDAPLGHHSGDPSWRQKAVRDRSA